MFKEKYIKYKTKYTALKKQLGGTIIEEPINYKDENFNLIKIYLEEPEPGTNYLNKITLKKIAKDSDGDLNLTLIIKYNPDLNISIENLWSSYFDGRYWLVNLLYKETIENLQLHIAAINNRENQINVYNTIIKYLEIFLDKYDEKAFQDLEKITDIKMLLEKLKTVKENITELIIRITNLSEDEFEKYQIEADKKLDKFNEDD
jgi:hypothetical protein